MTNRFLLVICASLFLTACGGGGGGGGGTPVINNSNDDGGGETATPFSQNQNEYLPLIDGVGWTYELATSQINILAQSRSNGQFSLSSALQVGDEAGELSQIFSSTEEAVILHGIEASGFSFALDASTTVTFKSLAFSEGVVMVGDAPSGNPVAAQLVVDISAVVLGSQVRFENQTINVEATPEITNEPNPNIITPWGALAGVDVTASLRLVGQYLTQDVDITITETASYAKGVGPVSRSIAFALTGNTQEDLVSLVISGLSGLPEPVVYRYEGSNLIQPDVTVIRIVENVSPENYTLLNQDVFNALNWVAVSESVNGTVFELNVTLPTPIPGETLSAVLYLSERGSDDQIPLNVTLSIPSGN